MNDQKEIWKPIKGFEDRYSISNFGNIISIKTKKVLKPSTRNGYRIIVLLNETNRKTVSVHREVLNNFIGIPRQDQECNHKDGNKKNNHVNNLEWVTRRENVHHAIKHGLEKRNMKCHNTKKDMMLSVKNNNKNWAEYQYQSIIRKDQNYNE